MLPRGGLGRGGGITHASRILRLDGGVHGQRVRAAVSVMDWGDYKSTPDCYFRGWNTDKRLVVSGAFIFKMHDTYGLPWDVILGQVRQAKMVVDWSDLFLWLAGGFGWSNERIILEMRFPMRESFGKELTDTVLGQHFREYDPA